MDGRGGARGGPRMPASCSSFNLLGINEGRCCPDQQGGFALWAVARYDV